MPMKKGGARRKDRNFVAIPFQSQLSLGTLADLTAVRISLTSGVLLEDLFIISIDATVVLREHTAGEGPIYVGFAHTDYTVAEIKEALDVDALLGPSKKIEGEQARRLVRRWGTFRGADTTEIIALANGGNKRYRVGWTQQDGALVQGYIFNTSGAALTTGSVIEMDGVIYGRWLV